MGYGEGGLGKDGNRGIHAGTMAGDKRGAEGAVEVNSLTAPKGKLLGEPSMSGPMAQQMIPTDSVSGIIDISHQMSGEAELLGQGVKDEGTLSDDEYPNISAPHLPGESGSTDAGQQGDAVDWNSVAPFEYPDFGKQPSPGQKIADGIENVLPLT